MLPASTTSPFMLHDANAAPWILWTNKLPFAGQLDEKQTESLHSAESSCENKEAGYSQALSFQTPRYKAVLSRFEQVNKRATSYASWNS